MNTTIPAASASNTCFAATHHRNRRHCPAAPPSHRHASSLSSKKCSAAASSAPNPNRDANPLSCSALAQDTPLGLPPDFALPRQKLARLAAEFKALREPIERVKRLLDYASLLPDMSAEDRVLTNRVTGCTAQVWVSAMMDGGGRMRFSADSDSEITRGFCSCLVGALDGARPAEVMAVGAEDLADLNVVGLPAKVSSRANTWHNVLVSLQKRTEAIVAEREGRVPNFDPFPSLVIGMDGIGALGTYAEAQTF